MRTITKLAYGALVTAVTFFTLMFASVLVSLQAPAWELGDMNKTIEQTNFIVNRGCAGTLVSLDERLVLTNYHCVDGLIGTAEREQVGKNGTVKKVKVRKYDDVPMKQNNYDGFVQVGSASYVAEIQAANQQVDLALVKLKGKIPHSYASPLLPDDGEIVRGERVYVVGNPAFEDATVVEGIVSNVNRTFEFPWTDAPLAMIQFSGGIFGGNSGGALYNSRGQLIGVPAAGYRAATFIGFAVPVHVIKKFLADNCFKTGEAGLVGTDKECVDTRAAQAKKDEAKGE